MHLQKIKVRERGRERERVSYNIACETNEYLFS